MLAYRDYYKVFRYGPYNLSKPAASLLGLMGDQGRYLITDCINKSLRKRKLRLLYNHRPPGWVIGSM